MAPIRVNHLMQNPRTKVFNLLVSHAYHSDTRFKPVKRMQLHTRAVDPGSGSPDLDPKNSAFKKVLTFL